jgi:hypothetical protein
MERWEGLNYRICENCFKKLGATTMNLQMENSIFETELKVQQALQNEKVVRQNMKPWSVSLT